MKKLLFFFLVMGCLLGLTPPTKVLPVKFPKSKLIEATTIKDLIIFPKGCKISGYSFRAEVDGSLKEFAVKGPGFSKEIVSELKNFKRGQLFAIEKIKSSCPKSHKKSYEIIVD